MLLETDDIRHYHAAAVLDKLVETIVHFMGRYIINNIHLLLLNRCFYQPTFMNGGREHTISNVSFSNHFLGFTPYSRRVRRIL